MQEVPLRRYHSAEFGSGFGCRVHPIGSKWGVPGLSTQYDANQAAGEGTNDLKTRIESLEARNTELDEECDNSSNRQDEQSLMYAE